MDIDEAIKGSRRPLIIAHRGASFYHRENTIEAFQAALNMGSEMIEFDVRRTGDGVLVVHHDRDFNGADIPDLTMEQIRESSGSARHAVPELPGVLRLCGGKVLLDIELKEEGYEEQVLGTVLDFLEPDRFLISSAHETVIRKVKELRPEIRTGLVLYRGPFPGCLGRLFPASGVRRSRADVLVVSKGLLKMGFIRFNARLEKPVWVYTVNDREKLGKHIADPGIGGIFTDRPDLGMFLRDLYEVGRGKE